MMRNPSRLDRLDQRSLLPSSRGMEAVTCQAKVLIFQEGLQRCDVGLETKELQTTYRARIDLRFLKTTLAFVSVLQVGTIALALYRDVVARTLPVQVSYAGTFVHHCEMQS
ncbi:hypothetical protein IQ07DRAFT_135936 [Pyrenochaeta sp. DS3sAY3a]|nr:hypothetical protein IQ07DRAFT_135936 [Pyrenochaeta sp. DS3sAY3a]